MHTAKSYRYLRLEDFKRFCNKHQLMQDAEVVKWKKVYAIAAPQMYGETVTNNKVTDEELLTIVTLTLQYSGVSKPALALVEEYVNVLNTYCTTRIIVNEV